MSWQILILLLTGLCKKVHSSSSRPGDPFPFYPIPIRCPILMSAPFNIGKYRINDASQKLEKKAEEIRARGYEEVDRGASKAKSGIAYWFGFGGK